MSYQTYKCPVCGETMPEYKNEEEDDSSNDTKYDKTIYRCKADDVWVTLEEPMGDTNQTSW